MKDVKEGMKQIKDKQKWWKNWLGCVLFFNKQCQLMENYLTLLLLNTTCPEEANWSGSALFVIKYVNLYQKTRIK